ncbi:peptidylprolyl isomerase [Anaerolineae bacterium CFX9]|jgi:peptidyl-prolyl cis-trans isomerase B (cyclophilin B)|nr:peptidylprolyl isomerase [Anaerolineae bacterium CFX9]
MANSYASPPAMSIDPNKRYIAHFQTTKGDFDVELYAANAPITVNNFVFLAREGFYDGVPFHRVIDNFMAQGGDPTGTGRGGPGYKWNDEPAALQLRHDTGSISMANAGPNTNGSQFFICYAPQPHLNGKHAVFGKVIGSGMSVVQQFARSGAPDKMLSVTITES